MNSSWRRILSLLLTLTLVLGLTTPAFAASSSNSSRLKTTVEKVEQASALSKQLLSGKKVEKLEDEVERLKIEGIEIGPIMEDWTGVRFCFIKDYDGLLVELHE